MGFWSNLISGLNPGSSGETTSAYEQANKSIQDTQNLANQYTGNVGYQNTLNQAIQGAGQVANQAVGTATTGARAGGMSKAQASAMGSQMGNQALASNFQNQQGIANQLGQNAIAAQQGITSAQQAQTSQAQAEKQNQFNRATGVIDVGRQVMRDVGNAASGGKLFNN